MTNGLGSRRVTPVSDTPAADDAGPAPAPRPPRPPRALDVVLAGAVIEAAGLGAGVVWAAVDLVRGRSEAPGATVLLALLLAGTGTAVVAAARALRRGARRARGLVVTWQLLQAASGLALLGVADPPAGLLWGAGAAIALAVVVAAAALAPAALRFAAESEDAADGAADDADG